MTVPKDRRKSNWTFYLFSSTGKLLWTRPPVGGQTFGQTYYAPPFPGLGFMIQPSGAGRHDVWAVSVHTPWFPSVVHQIDAWGHMKGEYWSNGYITYVRAATWRGKPMVLMGARHNESEGASVALLDGKRVSGSAPAATDAYRCATCPPGQPVHFVVFPRPASLRALHATSPVIRIEAENSNGVLVWINHDDSHAAGLNVIYTLDEQLRPLSVGVADDYETDRAMLARAGLIPSPPAPDPVDELRIVRWWTGGRFVDLMVPATLPRPPRNSDPARTR